MCLLMRRNAQRAVVIDRARHMEMRRLRHPAHHHERDAQDAQHGNPVQPDSGEDRAHATASTITRPHREPQTHSPKQAAFVSGHDLGRAAKRPK